MKEPRKLRAAKYYLTSRKPRQTSSLVPRPRPSMRERGSGDFSRFSWHFVRFKSCDTCLCACAFQQRARDIAKLRIVSCLGGGVWVAVTREFERDNCVTSEILQSDWTTQIELECQENQLKFPDPLSCGSHVRVWGRDYQTRARTRFFLRDFGA